MKTLVFKDGTTIDFVECYGRQEYVLGVRRSVLDFRFDPALVSLNEVDEKFRAGNCDNLIIRDQSDEFAYDGYEIRVSISKQLYSLVSEKGEESEVEQISVKLAQLTKVEKQLKALGIEL